MIHSKRIRKIKNIDYSNGPVVYWMSRDQRIRDNWALLYCQHKALEYHVPMVVVFCLVQEFSGAEKRHYQFMVEGLKQIARGLGELNISFHLLQGEPVSMIPKFLKKIKAGLLITDFDPLKIKRSWQEGVNRKSNIPMVEVDAHNIVPCWEASQKQEYAAYTLRPKIHKRLFEFLEPFPEIHKHPVSADIVAPVHIDWQSVLRNLKVEDIGGNITVFKSGEQEAGLVLKRFIKEKLDRYNADRNDPTKSGVSDLSPYLHFGQISAQRIAHDIENETENSPSKEAFLEELIVRRELSDNFCYYNPCYNAFNGFPAWARKTLSDHRLDTREFIYSFGQFENAETHDPLWNACQMEMVKRAKMHGYMRMYWAKKILEWTPSVEEALQIAITLNDRYELDGRDANGYAGIAWALGGVHDRAWFERPVFGKIRYMNDRGCRSKFDVDRYIKLCNAL
jgi:deoxyribodipyrimidine photo-lyase